MDRQQTDSEGPWVRILTTPAENSDIDYKRAMYWDKATRGDLAKDIAAFANSQGGGTIVVGLWEKEAGLFEQEGLSPEQAGSFDTTHMLNWINERFTPPIKAECRRVQFGRKMFVLISVQQFDDIPCLCTKEFREPGKKSPTLRRGALYVRTNDASCRELGRAQELRELVQIAVRNQADRFAVITKQLLTAGGMDGLAGDADRDKQLVDLKRSLAFDPPPKRGWLLQFSLLPFNESRWPDEAKLREALRKSRASLVETFPHGFGQSAEHGLREILEGRYSWYVCYSGTFVCWLGDESDVAAEIDNDEGCRDVLYWQWTVYTMASFFSFMTDFSFEGEPDAVVEYEVRRMGLAGRTLYTKHPLHAGSSAYTRDEFSRSNQLSVTQLRADKVQECAWALTDLLDGFGASDGLGRWLLRDPEVIRGQVCAALKQKL